MNLKRNKALVFLFTITVFIGCKSAKTVTSNGELKSNLSTKQLVKETKSKKANFKTLASRVKINIEDGEKSKSYTVNLRVEKDKQILLTSTPITLVKALITPTRVAFYNKLDGTYFDGDFSYISELLGTDLDFNKVQNLLLGEAILDIDAKSYKSETYDKSYLIQPKKQQELYEILFLFNPTYFKLDSQQISQLSERRLLEIDYLAYQKVETETLPKQISIIAVQKNEQLKIDLEYKAVSLNENLRFPFRIPSGYDKIEL